MGHIGRSNPSGSNQYPWKLVGLPVTAAVPSLLTSTAALSAVGAYAHQLSLPAPTAALAVIRNVDPANSLALKFFGTGVDNSTYTARLWGGRPLEMGSIVSPEFLFDHLLDLTITLGGAVINTSSVKL